MMHMFIIVLLLAWTSVVLPSRLARQAPESCTCVPYYLCIDGVVLTSGEGILGVRNLDVNFQSDVTPPPEVAAKGNPCNTFELCCKTDTPSEVVTGDVTPTSEDVTGDGSGDVTGVVAEPQTTPIPPPIHTPKCGVRNTEGVNTRILNPFLEKDESKFAEFPWQAALLRKEGAAGILICGATLIGPRFVLTAAHCVMSLKAEQVMVRLGEYDSQSTGEQFPHQDVDASEITIHPDFNKRSLFNDIALIYLAEPAKFAPNIDTACIPKAGQEYPTGKRCTVTGWGKSAFGTKGLYSSKLKLVDVPVVDNPKCQELLRRTKLDRFFVLHSSFLCAGGEKGSDACKGDGGGPLVCEENGSYSVAGIVAWGIGCGDENVPGVYVKVSQFTTWIEGIFAAKNVS